jgi:hypothetical protein
VFPLHELQGFCGARRFSSANSGDTTAGGHRRSPIGQPGTLEAAKSFCTTERIMQNRWLGIDRPQQHGGIADVDPKKRRQQWLQERHGNNLRSILQDLDRSIDRRRPQ